MVHVPPELYELIRLVVHLAGCLYAEYGGRFRHSLRALTHDLRLGLRYDEAKRRTHDQDHAHSFSELLGQLQDDSDIVSIKHAPKRRRQEYFSGGCFHPPPRPCFLFEVHRASMMNLSALKRV